MTITFQGDDIVAPVSDPDTTILSASIANKIPHFRECGGQGRCTTCRVRILDGINHVSERSSREARLAQERGWDTSIRLACQTRVHGNVRVRRLIQSAADVLLLQTETLGNDPGQEVQVAILMCDIRQFTPFVETHLPYDVFHILNRFFGELGEPILLNGGFIYQYVGDQIVGLFGLEKATAEQSCLGAVRAGLGMIRALRSLNTRIRDEFGVELGVRIGVHYGPLIVGNLGHPVKRDFSVVGDAMNVASRIEQANEELGTTLLVSEALYEHLSVPVQEGQRASVSLKGKRGVYRLIEVLGFAEPDPDLIVQETARLLLGGEGYFAKVFYRRLFEAAPEARHMFSGDLETQGRMLTQVLQLAIYGLSRFHEVIPGLVALGRGHMGYGVRPEHYVLFREVFLDTVREILGPACDTDVATAWGHAIDRILEAMCLGAGYRFHPEAMVSHT